MVKITVKEKRNIVLSKLSATNNRPFKRRFRKSLRDILWSVGKVLTPPVITIWRHMPRGVLLALARGVGSLWYNLIPSSRQLGLNNLDLVFANTISKKEKARICRESLKSILTCMMDFYYFSHRKESPEFKVLVDPACEEKIRSITGKGKGALILTAHLGNWELLFWYLRRFGKISPLARNQKDFERYVVECRARYGVGTIYDSSSSTQLISDILARGEMVAFIFDRNLSHTKGIIAEFMGHPAFTPYFPVNIAMNGHVPVVGAFLTQEGRNYRLHIEDPIEVTPLQDKEETYAYYVKIFLDLIEKYIRLYPDQWFWAHKRWGRPKGDVAFE